MAAHRSLRRGAVALAAGLVMGAVAAGSAAGQEAASGAAEAPATTTVVPGTPGRVDPDVFRDLATQVARNERELAELTARLEQLDARIAELTSELADTVARLEHTRAELARLRDLVRTRAAFIYAHARTPVAMVDIERVEDIASGKKYAESATRSDMGRITGLEELERQLDQRRRDLEAAKQEHEAERERTDRARDDLERLLAKQRRALDAAGAITVIGEGELTAEEIAAWFNSRGVRYRLSGGTTITDLAQLYIEEGAAEHVRPELAFVQAVLETGSFGNATDNNYAGIGACDSCTGQIAFPTPRDGVRGQIQMLRNYADPESRAANLAYPPSAPIYGSDPVRAAVAYDTFFAKGRVPTWNLMGNGNWATDPGYAPKVLTLYFQLMSFATRRA